MICILAPTFRSAERWANGQMLKDDEWFYPSSEEALIGRINFHVIVADGGDIPNGYLNRMLSIAWRQGRKRND